LESVGHIRRGHIAMSFTRMLHYARRTGVASAAAPAE
jgi:hypothetical protein